MKYSKLISIIIPIFNPKEIDFRICLNSLEKIKSEMVEILLIDDGSDAYVKKICEEYLKKNDIYTYIWQNNRGVSVARNKGIEKSKGKYLIFVDSDDEVSSKYIDKLLNEIKRKQYDFYLTDYLLRKKRKEIYFKCSDKINRNNIMQNLFNSNIPTAPWAKVYSKEILDKNSIRFDDNLRVGEDFWFNYLFFKRINSLKTVKNEYYIYYQREYSTINSKFNEKHLDSIKVINMIENDLEKNNYILCLNDLKGRKCLESILIFKKLPKSDVKIRNEIESEIKKNRIYLLKSKNYSIKDKIKSIIYRFL